MNKKTKKNDKKIGIIASVVTVVVIVVVIVVAALVMSNKSKLPMALDDDEDTAILVAQSAATQGVLRGSGKITTSYCETLGQLAQKTGGDWFERCSSITSINSDDTAETDVVRLSDGSHCASFVTDKDRKNLIEYSFTNESCDGYTLIIGD